MEEPDAEQQVLMAIHRDGEDLAISFFGESEDGQQACVSRTLSYDAAIDLAAQIIQSAGRCFEKPSGPVIVLEDLT